jgi:hypothetical protein
VKYDAAAVVEALGLGEHGAVREKDRLRRDGGNGRQGVVTPLRECCTKGIAKCSLRPLASMKPMCRSINSTSCMSFARVNSHCSGGLERKHAHTG